MGNIGHGINSFNSRFVLRDDGAHANASDVLLLLLRHQHGGDADLDVPAPAADRLHHTEDMLRAVRSQPSRRTLQRRARVMRLSDV